MKKRTLALAVAASTFLLVGCAADSVEEEASGDSAAITIGSQDYYSNEIVAEIYAQALEDAGFDVERDFRIGQREVYLPELESGAIDVMPEYTGALLQFYNPETGAHEAGEVYDELQGVLPENLQVLDQSEANDQDSYVVRADDPAESLGDLAGREGLVLGANSEIEQRPYGPDALAEVYGVDVEFTPIEDSGGPLTVSALREGDIDVADIYTASPALAAGDLKVLDDPENLFIASHFVPLAASDLDPAAADVINEVSAELDQEELVAMNSASVDEQRGAGDIAAEWLEENS